MANTVKTSIQIRDGMSPAMKSMAKNINNANQAFRALQISSANSVDAQAMGEVKKEISKLENGVEQVSVDLRDAAQNQDRFNQNVNRSNKSAGGLLKTVKRIAIAAGGIALGRKFIGMADQYASVQARLGLINDGQQSVNDLNNMIFQSADRARGAYGDMADVIGKLGITASDAFSSNQEMIQFSEIMTKSFKVAGASAQEQSSAMYQLTQAMASGRLQGDEFRSILENAPMLAKAIATEMGVTMGVLKEMSSEGRITSDVIKNAMFNSAQEINQQFEQMPMRFDEMMTKMQNSLTNKLQPAFRSLSAYLNSVDGQAAMEGITNGITVMANGIAWATQNALRFSAAVQNNWADVKPVVMGVVGALAAYKALAIGSAIATTTMTVATQAQTIGVFAAAKAQWGLNTALLASPYTWIAMAIGAVIAVTYNWIQSVGGLEVATMIMRDKLLTAYDDLRTSAYMLYHNTASSFENLRVGMAYVSVGILNILGRMKVGGINILRDFVNQAISELNWLIEKVNRIPGVSIDMIGKVSFGANAAIEEEAKRQARTEGLKAYTAEIDATQAERQQNLVDMMNQAQEDADNRRIQIIAAKLDARREDDQRKTESVMNQIASSSKATATNTGDMKDTLTIAEEDLKYMRDIAEREVIDRTILRDVKVDFKNTFGDIRETADVDGVIDRMSEKIQDAINSDGEGVFNV